MALGMSCCPPGELEKREKGRERGRERGRGRGNDLLVVVCPRLLATRVQPVLARKQADAL